MFEDSKAVIIFGMFDESDGKPQDTTPLPVHRQISHEGMFAS
jgi:hypothetical protein